MKVGILAEKLGLEFSGQQDLEVVGLCSCEKPKADHLGFAINRRALNQLHEAKLPLAILVPQKWIADDGPADICYLYSEQPYHHFVAAIPFFHPSDYPPPAVHPTAQIAPGCTLAEHVHVGAYSVIGADVVLGENVAIGSGCTIGPGVCIGANTRLDDNVVVYRACEIGADCRIYSGAIIGSEGFGLLFDAEGRSEQIPHVGKVIIGDCVRVGACSTIDRAVIDETILGSGVKLDNQVHIGHNAVIGQNTVIAGGVLVAGHARIGQGCKIGGGACIGGVSLADNITVKAMTGVNGHFRQPNITLTSWIGCDLVERWNKSMAKLRRMAKE